jgi:hypothetical protein
VIETASAVAIAMKPRIHRAMQVSVVALAMAACSQTPRALEPEAPLVPAARASGSEAEPVTSSCAEDFRVFDRDRDRQISLDELADRLDPSSNADLVFRQRDRDMNGFLIERELCARLGATILVTPAVPE